ncbi:MAG: hypothetical protein EBX41_09460, partial [Chitinophagia bacterium]|nr:hypothetical protein [Chitinophagia bacterium]
MPTENAQLHYRLVGFVADTFILGHTTLIIAPGNYSSIDSIKNHACYNQAITAKQTPVTLPSFGTPYSWYVSVDAPKAITYSIHHFSTKPLPIEWNPSQIRLRIVKNENKYKNTFIFSDALKAMTDMDGNILWYLYTSDPEVSFVGGLVRDLKVSPTGTITLLHNNIPYEISYTGKMLWKAPRNPSVNHDVAENYHHQFSKLSANRYMIMGDEPKMCHKEFQAGTFPIIMDVKNVLEHP